MAYTEPTPADLKMRYPAFAQVDDDTITYWLSDAHRYVDQSWIEGDYSPALIAHAAYEMAKRNVAGLAGGDMGGIAPAGITDFKSGAFQARFSDKAVEQALAGGYESNAYGQDYLDLLRRNKAGPRVTSPGRAPCGYGFSGFAGPLPPWMCP